VSAKTQGILKLGGLMRCLLLNLSVWNHITSQEAVGLVSTHLAHPEHAPLLREKVQDALIPQRKDSAARYRWWGGRDKFKGDWVYKDQNAATHLIRNAFDACCRHPNAWKQVITAKPPIARRLRDDVTCS
jgi:pyruvate dehydrogenase phosphatase